MMQHFQTELYRPEGKGSWTYITAPFSVEETFGTRGRVPVCGTIDGELFRSSLLPHGNGEHILVVKTALVFGQTGNQSGNAASDFGIHIAAFSIRRIRQCFHRGRTMLWTE